MGLRSIYPQAPLPTTFAGSMGILPVQHGLEARATNSLGRGEDCKLKGGARGSRPLAPSLKLAFSEFSFSNHGHETRFSSKG
jgi:hypothetical protein